MKAACGVGRRDDTPRGHGLARQRRGGARALDLRDRARLGSRRRRRTGVAALLGGRRVAEREVGGVARGVGVRRVAGDRVVAAVVAGAAAVPAKSFADPHPTKSTTCGSCGAAAGAGGQGRRRVDQRDLAAGAAHGDHTVDVSGNVDGPARARGLPHDEGRACRQHAGQVGLLPRAGPRGRVVLHRPPVQRHRDGAHVGQLDEVPPVGGTGVATTPVDLVDDDRGAGRWRRLRCRGNGHHACGQRRRAGHSRHTSAFYPHRFLHPC